MEQNTEQEKDKPQQQQEEPQEEVTHDKKESKEERDSKKKSKKKEKVKEKKNKKEKEAKKDEEKDEESAQAVREEDGLVKLSAGTVHYRVAWPAAASDRQDDSGDGLPVVMCVHGIDHVARVWDFLARHLAAHAGYAVVSFDLYDRGSSKLSDHKQPHTGDLFVQQVHELWRRVVHADESEEEEKEEEKETEEEEEKEKEEDQQEGEKKEEKSRKTKKGKKGKQSEGDEAESMPSLPPLRKDSFTLIGHSMGGAVSLLFAHKYPDLVNALVLIGPAGMKFSVPAEMQLMRLPALGPKLFQWFAKQEDMMKEDFMDVDASKDAIAHVMEHTRGMYGSSAFAHAFINSFKNFPLRDLEEIIPEVGKHARPSLILWGEHDNLISRELWMPRFEEAFGVGSTARHSSHMIRNTKHSAFLERIDEANKVVANFLLNKSDEGDDSGEKEEHSA